MALWLIGGATAARAAGGAHVVDDSDVEAPGLCHYEASAMRLSSRSDLVMLSPGCTGRAHSTIELGGYAAYSHTGGQDDGEIGVAPKVTLRPVNAGFGVAIDGALGFGLRHGRIETASLIVPMSLPISATVQINADVGGGWTAVDRRVRSFAGVQIVAQVRPRLQLMAESFDWSGLPIGGQAGIRWTIDDGRTDLDLLAARYVDGHARNAMTLGVTVRR